MSTENPEDHDSECPVVTGDGPTWAPTKCRCDYLAQLDDEYRAEPPDMFAREWG
ncbi:hypothetical protein GCM10023084_02980 [Streptomyces lacrimifluminis]|uniref:hypothetical protein n=1 Tax=Streptomyces lacrimifluminis TaxID=1500077 RepID=UPI0031F19712